MALAKHITAAPPAQLPTAVSIFEALPDDEKRKWEVERRIVRDGINKAKGLPRRHREALMYLTNLWFYHRNGDGFIHPGMTKLAEKLECSVRTAKTVAKDLRDAGYLVPLAYENGGRQATRYAVDLGLIVARLCNVSRFQRDTADEISRRSAAQINRAKSAANRAKIAHGISKGAHPKEPVREVYSDASDWVEAPF